jgi:hypothetical protein
MSHPKRESTLEVPWKRPFATKPGAAQNLLVDPVLARFVMYRTQGLRSVVWIIALVLTSTDPAWHVQRVHAREVVSGVAQSKLSADLLALLGPRRPRRA